MPEDVLYLLPHLVLGLGGADLPELQPFGIELDFWKLLGGYFGRGRF